MKRTKMQKKKKKTKITHVSLVDLPNVSLHVLLNDLRENEMTLRQEFHLEVTAVVRL